MIFKKHILTSISSVFLLVASYPSLSQPSFRGGFESGAVTGVGNHNWFSLQAFAPDRISIVKDSHGSYARVEVRAGDHELHCPTCTERSELVMMQDANGNALYENLSSGTQRYTFSVKFDKSWRNMVGNKNGAWGIFLQLHGPDDLGSNPAFELNANETGRIVFGMLTGDITKSKSRDYKLLNGKLNKGHWIDFILTIKYTTDKTGFVNLQRRDEGQTNFSEVLNILNTPTLQYSSKVNNGAVGNHYMKHGLYRNQETFTSILYLKGFTREELVK